MKNRFIFCIYVSDGTSSSWLHNDRSGCFKLFCFYIAEFAFRCQLQKYEFSNDIVYYVFLVKTFEILKLQELHKFHIGMVHHLWRLRDFLRPLIPKLAFQNVKVGHCTENERFTASLKIFNTKDGEFWKMYLYLDCIVCFIFQLGDLKYQISKFELSDLSNVWI